MRVLMIGDIVGRPGRQAIKSLLPGLRQEYNIDFVVANAENAAGGKGLTLETAHELLDAGVNVLSSGNHLWEYKEIIPHLDGPLPLLRPLNYPPQVPGKGYIMYSQVMVVNLVGRTFMGNFDCPFRAIDRLLEVLEEKPPIIIVDFHAEATSEKMAMGWYLDGRVSAVMGTHTHIGTIDARILPKGTAYVSDVGMTGPMDSVIGVDVSAAIERFLTHIPSRLPVGKGKVILNAILLDIDDISGMATNIQRIERKME